MTQLADKTVQQMLYIKNMNLKQYFEQYSGYVQMFLKQVNRNNGSTVLTYIFLNLGERESDENDDSNFEILLHFEEAIVAE